ncbi:MAG: hypothetical protein ACE14P_02845 [Methanotrichaceae archaeon]
MIPGPGAFFLATHNYDVRPLDGYVELRRHGRVYKVTPSSDKIQSMEG